MLSFFNAVVMLAVLHGGSFALPTTTSESIQKRNSSFWFPSSPSPANGPITAIGANGGYNYGGDGANGGYIGVNRYAGGSSVYASGANGGKNYYGNGANGGSISIGRRDEDFFFPVYGPYSARTNGPISAYGANGGYNEYGNGANGGHISINRREDDTSLPRSGGSHSGNYWQWYGYGPTYSLVDGLSLVGAYPVKPGKGTVIATGQNDGVSVNGDGANRGTISVPGPNRPKTETTGVDTHPVRYVKGTTVAEGQNGGVSIDGEGANGGTISVPSNGNNRHEIVDPDLA